LYEPVKSFVSPIVAKNFQSCWNGKDVDSADHKSHVSYRTGGPDSGDCPSDFPINIPRIFSEMYYNTGSFNDKFNQAKNTSQPFVYVDFPKLSRSRS